MGRGFVTFARMQDVRSGEIPINSAKGRVGAFCYLRCWWSEAAWGGDVQEVGSWLFIPCRGEAADEDRASR